ncbi:MAG: hypothetical protein ABIC91_02930 [Nanoarchaeota archaeon]|nr:hypothetical protein [Nanoarchaeota archaeon]MBU1030544.1 hypothetical protein [Nanoarchaeota archaeon]MBU1850549.1 hypothetical protein [Nanoarchaeota archaeon]
MRKGLISILLIISLLFVACGEKESSTSSNAKAFIGGTTGLAVEFIEGEPPEEVIDGAAMLFTTSVKIKNKGEWAIAKENITLSLKGFDPADFGLTLTEITDVNPDEDILKNDINPDTGNAINSPDVYVTFPTLNFQRVLSGNQEFPFVVDVCYSYGTLANSKLCIKENLLDTINDEVCIVSGSKNVENSGGPIQVTGFEEFTAGQDKVSFTINLEDKGTGKLSALGSSCDQTPANKGVVKISVDTGLSGLVCSGLSNSVVSAGTVTAYVGETKLSTGQKSVRCTQTIAEKSDKIKIVDITLEYDYMETIASTVLVKHVVQ